LGITPNRGDCLSFIGVARELAAKLATQLVLPEFKPRQLSSFSSNDRIAIVNEVPDECGRFTALAIDQVAAATSPLWLRQRLLRSGMRPLNLIVDVANYVMLETGQPIHTYDARELADKKIGVRRGVANEPLTTLDGQQRQLTADDLVIFDGNGPVGLAGVM